MEKICKNVCLKMPCGLFNFKKVSNFALAIAEKQKIIKRNKDETYIPTIKQKES